jgi:hypothetical protein
LTHDVLCRVVRSSRNLRHEREARVEAERQLAEQQERVAQLREASKRLDLLSTEANQLLDIRELRGWIAAA